MEINTFSSILPLVQRPSSYLGSEKNSIKKDPATVNLKFALAFPDLYEIGTSHFGMQILYSILNEQQKIAAERIFAPGQDMEAYLKSSNTPIVSLESHTPVGDFDIIGFSLLYELNFTNILTILDLAGIPFFAKDRDLSYPLIIAGGPCTCNPEPVAEFFDIMVMGDGEETILEISNTWLQWKKNDKNNKEQLLKMLSDINGVYVPSFFEPEYNDSDFQKLTPKYANISIKRAIIDDLDKAPFPDHPIVPFGKPVHDRLRLEIARGCTRGCRFCQAGMIYRPARERSPDNLLKLSDLSLASTGYDDISLLSLSAGDYCSIEYLMESLMTRDKAGHIAVSLPSFRAGTISPKLMNIIKTVRKTGFTIAPEAGSQRMRDIINKNITAADIENTVLNALDLGWTTIKLYFMIGLPTETDEDLEAICELVKKLRGLKNKKSGKKLNLKINVSISTFIPKPHTPFQWCSQISLKESKEKIAFLKDRLRRTGIHFKWQNPETSLMEGLWARGDRRLSPLLVSAYKKGCRLDGWSDMFRFDLWKEAMAETGIDIDFFTIRPRKTDEPLPWDHINSKIKKEFLKKEFNKGLASESTGDCRFEECNGCGSCDFETIKPVTYPPPSEKNIIARQEQSMQQELIYKKFKIFYSKTGSAKYFGHLELANIFIRALKQENIPLKFSQGYHPKPRISFEDPLPIGLESLSESLYITVPESIKPDMVANGLNRHLPEGLSVFACEVWDAKKEKDKIQKSSYTVILKNKDFNKKELENFTNSLYFSITRTNKKGKEKNIDLKKVISNITLKSENILKVVTQSDSGKTLRPDKMLPHIFTLSENEIKQAKITKIS